MTLPKKISPCPIVDSILELRFATSFPHDAIFGIVYNAFKSDYPRYESLPILQLPEPVRKADPNLKFKPYYRLSNDKFVIQIGADVATISSFPEYVGWDIFKTEITSFFNTIKALAIIDDVSRIALRVINFFPDVDIFQQAKIALIISEEPIVSQKTLLNTGFVYDHGINSTLNISNDAMINLTQGSIIDIDTFREYNKVFDVYSIISEIEMIHDKEKALFFSLLKDDFLKKFNPEY
jgi:uncharacterized protein (TIGR04255 family)